MRVVGLVFRDEAAEKFCCPHCGKEYKTKTGLAKHMEEEHPEEKGNKDEGED